MHNSLREQTRILAETSFAASATQSDIAV